MNIKIIDTSKGREMVNNIKMGYIIGIILLLIFNITIISIAFLSSTGNDNDKSNNHLNRNIEVIESEAWFYDDEYNQHFNKIKIKMIVKSYFQEEEIVLFQPDNEDINNEITCLEYERHIHPMNYQEIEFDAALIGKPYRSPVNLSGTLLINIFVDEELINFAWVEVPFTTMVP